jgi:DNA-nicking Smr family endonuclease
VARKRGLSPEEEALWRLVAESAQPLKRQRNAASAKPAAPKPEPAEKPAPIAPFRVGEKAPVLRLENAKALPVRMDRKAFAALSKGKLRPEGRIDLHGMTLAEAHPELMRFILGAAAMGRRLVLVITGKGRERDEGGPIPVPRGILKEQVPRWLSAPPLAPLVLHVAQAHRRHGGAGAYYVYLRRGLRG